jgi:phosphoserine phosphatase
MRCNTVVFDCDSTLSAIEGIEFLAQDHQAEIAALTELAMSGAVPLEDVFARRLALVQPSHARLEELGREYVRQLVPDAGATIAALQEEGVRVCIISGGLAPAVHAVAVALKIAPADVAAVAVQFDENGGYLDFDRSSPLARSGGKAEVLQAWRHELPRPVMLVGDGATDVEAKPAVDVFVAYTGVASRPAVVAGGDAVIRSASLAPVLPLALGGIPPHGAAALHLFNRGLGLLAGDAASG